MSESNATVDDRTSEERDRALDDAGAVSRGDLPPGPDGIPIAGNTLQFVRDPFGYYEGLDRYGDVVRHRIVGKPFTVLFHPDHVERVLVGEPHRFEQYDFGELGQDFAPEGLLRSRGEQWRRQRALIQPAFSPAKIAAFADDIVTLVADTTDRWSDGETIVADQVFSDLTLEILTKTLFDVDVAERRAAITDGARRLNDTSDMQTLSAVVPKWVPTPRNLRYRRSMARFDETVGTIIDERRDADEDRPDLLSTLLEATDDDGRRLSDSELRDQLVTFFFAGHETSSLALTYASLLLATHDEQRERLEDELEAVCGDADPTMADLPELEYTEKAVTETLRLYPPAYVAFREALEDVVIDGYLIPEGTYITISQYFVHRDERWYDDPEAFRPERWTDELEAELPEYAYFPFGGGPRHCVAMRFARLELQLALATIAQRVRFDLESDPDPELRMTATLTPAEDVELTVRKRTGGD